MKSGLMALLQLRGVHYLVTRFGPGWLKSLAFDGKYQSGVWDFTGGDSNELAQIVASRARGGDILVMGCGSASFLQQLDPTSYNTVLGIDLSAEAVRLAGQYGSRRVRFEVGDMTRFECQQAYDVILFSESIYYVSCAACKSLLVKLAHHLKPGGCFIVTIAQAKRYESILTTIRSNFTVMEDREFDASERHLLVFAAPKGVVRPS